MDTTISIFIVIILIVAPDHCEGRCRRPRRLPCREVPEQEGRSVTQDSVVFLVGAFMALPLGILIFWANTLQLPFPLENVGGWVARPIPQEG